MLPFHRENNGEGSGTIYLFHILLLPAIEYPCGACFDFPGSPGFHMALSQQARNIVERTVRPFHHPRLPSCTSFYFSKFQTPPPSSNISRHRKPPSVFPLVRVSFHTITRLFID